MCSLTIECVLIPQNVCQDDVLDLLRNCRGSIYPSSYMLPYMCPYMSPYVCQGTYVRAHHMSRIYVQKALICLFLYPYICVLLDVSLHVSLDMCPYISCPYICPLFVLVYAPYICNLICVRLCVICYVSVHMCPCVCVLICVSLCVSLYVPLYMCPSIRDILCFLTYVSLCMCPYMCVLICVSLDVCPYMCLLICVLYVHLNE